MTIEEEMKVRYSYGYKEGRSEGEAIGAAQEKREIAKAMKDKSMPVSEIAELTGLTAEEVESL